MNRLISRFHITATFMVSGNTVRISDDELAAIDALTFWKANLLMAVMPKQRYSATQLTHLANIQRAKHRLTGKPQGEDRFHITLHELGYDGRPPLDFVREVSAAAEEAAAPVPPFEIKFDRVSRFGGNAYVLCGRGGNDALQQFRERLGTTLSNRSLRYERSKFEPHITLLYDPCSPLDEGVEPVSWIVNEVTLVISLAGETKYLIPEPILFQNY